MQEIDQRSTLEELLEMTPKQREELTSELVVKVISNEIFQFDEYSRLDSRQEKTLNQVLELLERQPKNDPSVNYLLVIVLGKLGNFAKAIEIAQQVYAHNPNWTSATSLANAYRRSKDMANYLQWLLCATTHDPEDTSALLEIGDYYTNIGQWADAIPHYELALKRDRNQPWARPSLNFCHYKLTSDKKYLRRLQDTARKAPDQCGMGSLFAQFLGKMPSEIGIARAKALLEKI